PRKRTSGGRPRYVRFVPEADISRPHSITSLVSTSSIGGCHRTAAALVRRGRSLLIVGSLGRRQPSHNAFVGAADQVSLPQNFFFLCYFFPLLLVRSGRARRLAPRVSDASVRLDENARPQSDESAGQQITPARRLVLGQRFRRFLHFARHRDRLHKNEKQTIAFLWMHAIRLRLRSSSQYRCPLWVRSGRRTMPLSISAFCPSGHPVCARIRTRLSAHCGVCGPKT